ncbi:MAG: hypothetical protein R3D29_10050 [Nitratireductor sp.]
MSFARFPAIWWHTELTLGEAEILRQLKAVERNVRAELLATD